MKTVRSFLAALLLVGGLAANSSAEVLSKTELVPVSSYCHLKFAAISDDSLYTDHPMLQGAESGDIIDFYGPCDEMPTGQNQIEAQKRDFERRLAKGYSD